MRVVIVQPPIEDFYLTPHRLSALGGFSIKTLLEKQGHEAWIINFPLLAKKGRQSLLPSCAEHLKPFLLEEKGPLAYFTRWKRWGPEPEECARQILDTQPDIVMLSLFAWAYGHELVELARAVKRVNPEAAVMAGGAGVSVFPAFFARSDHIDLVLQGEGESLFKEFSLNDLVRRISHSADAPGDCNDKIVKTGRFCSESEMEPVFSLTTSSRNHIQAAAILTRGCPRDCRFCSNHLTQGRRLRQTPLDKLESRFYSWLDRADLSPFKKLTLDLEDDNLLMDKSYTLEVLDLLLRVWRKKGRSHKDLFFTAENGMDYELLDNELLDQLIDRGFRQFNFSLASADRKVLEQEKRFFSPEKLTGILGILKEKNIPAVSYFICGLDGDTLAGIGETLNVTGDLPSQTGISLFYPVPGLEGFEDNHHLSMKIPGLCRGSLAYPWTKSLSTEQLLTAFRLSRFTNLIKSDQKEVHGDLIKLIFKTGKLHTYDRGGKKIPLPCQDGELVSNVLDHFSRKLFR